MVTTKNILYTIELFIVFTFVYNFILQKKLNKECFVYYWYYIFELYYRYFRQNIQLVYAYLYNVELIHTL